MKRGPTLLLRAVIVLIAIIVLAICILVLPDGLRDNEATAYHPIILGMYITAIPFFIALSQAFKLLQYIDANKAFSEATIKALKYTKYCAFAISALYAIGMPYIFYVADKDDAPGVAAIGFIIIGASFVLGTAIAVFQSLVQNAIDIKSENDLTV